MVNNIWLSVLFDGWPSSSILIRSIRINCLDIIQTGFMLILISERSVITSTWMVSNHSWIDVFQACHPVIFARIVDKSTYYKWSILSSFKQGQWYEAFHWSAKHPVPVFFWCPTKYKTLEGASASDMSVEIGLLSDAYPMSTESLNGGLLKVKIVLHALDNPSLLKQI